MIAGLFFFLVLAVILDLRTYRIPNALTMAGMAVGVIYQLYRAGPPGMFRAVKDLVISIMLLFPLYWIKCLGAGDIKLLSVVAIFLGWKQGVIVSIYSLFAGALMGVIKWSVFFGLRRKKSKDQCNFRIIEINRMPAEKQAIKRHIIKNLGKEVDLYFAGKTAGTAFLKDKKSIKEVVDRLQNNFIWFLSVTKTDKNRQKERNHIEQIRSANQLLKSNKNKEIYESNKKGQIGENNQNYHYLNQKDQLNVLNHNNRNNHNKRINRNHLKSQENQLSITNQKSYSNCFKEKKQMQHKKGAGDQGCVIHYSIAILIAFLVACLS